jgi:hypothetical protein
LAIGSIEEGRRGGKEVSTEGRRGWWLVERTDPTSEEVAGEKQLRVGAAYVCMWVEQKSGRSAVTEATVVGRAWRYWIAWGGWWRHLQMGQKLVVKRRQKDRHRRLLAY